MDIDLLGKIDNRLEVITAAIKDACLMDVVEDGISFNAETVEAVRITEDMESTIAEKFQAMVKLGVLNSRMKDFYDIWILSSTFDFKGEVLSEAVEKTFSNRNTLINLNAAIFDPSFGKDRDKNVQWQGFIRKTKLINTPESFEEVIAVVRLFLEPLVTSIVERQAFNSIWTAPGPWR
jgi:hypothetical protein